MLEKAEDTFFRKVISN